MTKKSTKTGPKPTRVKIDKPWEKAVADALKQPRPKGGWPEVGESRPKDRKPDKQKGG